MSNQAKTNNGAFTGSLGITHLPKTFFQWRLNVTTAFRAPNIDDIGKVFDSEPGAVVVPNNNIKPEYAVGGEVGFIINLKSKVIIDVAGYYTYLDNALTRQNFNLNGATEIIYNGTPSTVQAIQNAASAKIYGLEFGAEFALLKNLKLTSKYNIIKGEEEDNGAKIPSRHVAPNFGSTHLIFNYKKINLETFLMYNDELPFNKLAPSEISEDYLYATDENGNPYAPSWYTLNLRSTFQITDKFQIITSLENITDQRYRPYSSGISAAGRNFICSVNYKF